MISFIAKIFVALNSNSRPGELASGIAFGISLALIPGGNLLWFLIFAIAFMLKHNLAAMLLSVLVFSLPASLADPLLHKTGLAVLSTPALQDLFTRLYNTPVLPWLRFNNTMIMGSLIWSILLWLPLFILFRILVRLYRNRIASRLAESKLVKSLKGVPWISKVFKAYSKFSIFA